ncbi:MAG: Flp family type IVb pilin [Streptosporangiaceae bacterium]
MFRPQGLSTARRLARELPGRQPSFPVSSCFVIMENLIAGALLRDDGATAVEYGLIAALIAAVIAGVVAALGVSVNQMFTNLLGAF